MTRKPPLWLQAGTYAASVDRELPGALWPTPATSGGQVVPAGVGGMNVDALPGRVAVPTSNNTGTVLCPWDAPETVPLDPSPPAGTNRIDRIICRVDSTDVGGASGDVFVIAVVKGAEAATPVAPATPANAVALADVYVGGGVAAIVAGNITDRRPGGMSVSGVGRIFFDVTGANPQNMTSGAPQKINALWGAPRVNVGGGTWAAGTYTVPRAARLHVTHVVSFNANNVFSTNFQLNNTLYRNGAGVSWGNVVMANLTAGMGVTGNASRILDCVAGDLLDVWVNQSYITATHALLPAQTFLQIEESPVPL